MSMNPEHKLTTADAIVTTHIPSPFSPANPFWIPGTPVTPIPSIIWTGADTETKKEDPTLKPTNPKDLIGAGKIPMHLFPSTAIAMGAMGLMDGALKYGRSNYRAVGIRATVYIDAMLRHIYKLLEGIDTDEDSGLPQEAHILACIAIYVDAKAKGLLNDDRNIEGGLLPLMKELTPHVARLKELHAAKSPKHYTIADNTEK